MREGIEKAFKNQHFRCMICHHEVKAGDLGTGL
jgi:hypothetical protein